MAMEKFHADTSAGKVTLPRFGDCPVGIIRKARKAGGAEATFAVLEAMADEKNLAIIDQLPRDEFNQLMQDWNQDSEITPGESSASSMS